MDADDPGQGLPPAEEKASAFAYREYALEDYVVLVAFWVLAGVVFAQFFSRYALNSAITWTEEIARYLLIVVGFLGSVMGVRKGTHIFVEVFYRFMPTRLSVMASRTVDLVQIIFFGVGALLSWQMIPIMHQHRMVSVKVPMSVIYIVVFVSFLLMLLRSVQVAYRHWRDRYLPYNSQILDDLPED